MNSLVLASLSLPNLVSRLPGGVAQGIIWGIMALGVYITFRLLDVADLTVDGSFTTGGAVTVVLIVAGWPAWAALLVAVAAGLLAGFVTGLLHTKLGIPAILAGILTQFALYSINLRIMSMKANTPVNPDKYDLFLTLRSVPGAIWKGLLLAAVLVGCAMLLPVLSELFDFCERVLLLTDLPLTLFVPVVKVTAIALVARFSCALCADAGQSALSSLLAAAGTLCALVCALPLMEALLEMVEGFL